MPSNAYGTRRILCPFYRTQDGLSIGCEGPFEGAMLTLRFLNVPDKAMQKEVFCEENYKRCEIYRCVMANRYPEKDMEE